MLYAVCAAAVVAFMLFVYKCPIKLISGYDCPGCGMTRALLALLRLDIKSAFGYHHLFPVPLLLLVYIPLRKRIGLSTRTEAVALAVILALFAVRWLILLFL